MSRCPNCSAELTGEYCSACGQRTVDPADLSVRRFSAELADEVATLGTKLKTVRSLRGLLTPGLLTSEFLSGRRQRYLTPIQLYLVCATLFFLAAPFAGFTLASLVAGDGSGTLGRQMTERAQAVGSDSTALGERFDLRVQSVYTVTLGLGVVAVALMQKLMRRAMPVGAHLAFALHYFAFLYLITAAAGAIRRLGVGQEFAAALALGISGTYLFLAVRRVYPGSVRRACFEWAVLMLLTLVCNYLANLTAIRVTLALL